MEVFPVINGSIWNAFHFDDNDYYRLTYCPEDYDYADINTSITSSNIASIFPNQECSACLAGYECIHPPCLSCSKCLPGFYKECSGPTSCKPCGVNSYQPDIGSVLCTACPTGTTTKGEKGCVDVTRCVCDTQHYSLDGEGCLQCPAGLQCFGNESYTAIPLQFGESKWFLTNTSGKQLLDLAYCPLGYFIAGTVSTPAQLQCVQCAAGFECVDPPCFGACTKCKPGFYKAATILLANAIAGASYDNTSGSYFIEWIQAPCAPCPVNSYRSLEGGTEVGSCTNCPDRSSTNGLNGSISLLDCKCEPFYYSQGISNSAGSQLVCGDCPLGCVCSSDRSCALGLLPQDTLVLGNVQTNLKCPNPNDVIVGTWLRIETGAYTLISCPPGYTMLVSNSSTTVDTCVICPAGSYLLDEVTSPSTTCKPCPIGASCPGGNVVIAQAGYWQSSSSRRGLLSQAVLYQCPVGYCGDNNTCLNDRVGPVSLFGSVLFLLCNAFLHTSEIKISFLDAGLWALSRRVGFDIVWL